MQYVQKLLQPRIIDTKPEICLALPMKAWDNSEGISDSVITETIIPLMRRVAKKEKLRVTDLHTLFGSDRSLMQDDGIHPGRKGAEVMAGIVAEEIKRMKRGRKGTVSPAVRARLTGRGKTPALRKRLSGLAEEPLSQNDNNNTVKQLMFFK